MEMVPGMIREPGNSKSLEREEASLGGVILRYLQNITCI
jgi:hypothetical protein